MSQFEINAHRASLGDVRHRKNINNFSDAEIDTIRAAYLAVYGITNRDDNRGHQYWAGKHGRPEADCDHGRLFLRWHRAYLYGLEKAMQYHDPDLIPETWSRPNVRLGQFERRSGCHGSDIPRNGSLAS